MYYYYIVIPSLTNTPELHLCDIINDDPIGYTRVPNVLCPVTWKLECTPKIFIRGDYYTSLSILSCPYDILIYNECWLDDGQDLCMGMSYEYAMKVYRKIYNSRWSSVYTTGPEINNTNVPAI